MSWLKIDAISGQLFEQSNRLINRNFFRNFLVNVFLRSAPNYAPSDGRHVPWLSPEDSYVIAEKLNEKKIWHISGSAPEMNVPFHVLSLSLVGNPSHGANEVLILSLIPISSHAAAASLSSMWPVFVVADVGRQEVPSVVWRKKNLQDGFLKAGCRAPHAAYPGASWDVISS